LLIKDANWRYRPSKKQDSKKNLNSP